MVVAPAMARRQLPQGGIDDGKPVKARVNHGRWIVDCACGGAELAFDEGLFMCQACMNGGHKHKYRHLVFPKNRPLIEAALIQRPEPNRNWWPGESLAQLKAENSQHKEELL